MTTDVELPRIDDIAAKYIKLRDFKDQINAESKEKVAKIKDLMDGMEAQIMTFLNQTGQDSAKTPSGTVFKKTTTKVSVADWDVVLKFMKENDMDTMYYRNVSKEAVEAYIEEVNEVPPGLNITREVSISVNRPSKR